MDHKKLNNSLVNLEMELWKLEMETTNRSCFMTLHFQLLLAVTMLDLLVKRMLR